MASLLKVAFLGLGLMGSSFVERLSNSDEVGEIHAWNRTREKADLLRARLQSDKVHVHERISSAIGAADGIVLSMLSDYDATVAMLSDNADEIGQLKCGVHLASLCSGTSDGARQFAERVGQLLPNLQSYVDACYAGGPTQVVGGTGMLIYSVRNGVAAERHLVDVFDTLVRADSLVHAGDIGADKALDFAVVDSFFLAFVAFLNGLRYTDAANIEPSVYLAALRTRFADFPHAFEAMHGGLEARDYAPRSATLATWKSYFGCRPATPVTEFALALVERAAGEAGDLAAIDATSLQEPLRFDKEK
jgi:3-hydroxyisobutyrate dehydrogenase-like beta-hydroxyacid dehydrogenase